MKPLVIVAAAVVLITCGVFLFDAEPAASQDTVAPLIAAADITSDASDRFVVHEWGTFTSFSGSDGIKLEFRPLLENDLPAFVSTRFKQSGFWLGKYSLPAIQRMETPVTYFYTPVERDVSVSVEFPEGLLTEFYPPVQSYLPKIDPQARSLGSTQPHPEATKLLRNSRLDWGTVHLIPPSSLRAYVADPDLARRIGRHVEQTMVPEADPYGHYGAARVTDSAIVQVRHHGTHEGENTHVPAADYFEKFLFYRGLGNFELPLTLRESANDVFELVNSGNDEVRSVFLVRVEGDQIWFNRFERSAPHSRMTLPQSPKPASMEQLSRAMTESLVAEGLYRKEALAMVACWKSSWFGEQGTRLLYMVPTSVTDSLLPLHIAPAPDELVRVLVGRMEIMPSSQEQQILQLVEKSATARSQASGEDESFRSPSIENLLALGRLAEPALVRVRNVADSEQTRNEATLLIDELRDTHETP